MPVLELPVVGVQAEFLNLGDDHAEGDKVFFYQHLLSNLQIIQKINSWLIRPQSNIWPQGDKFSDGDEYDQVHDDGEDNDDEARCVFDDGKRCLEV